MFKEYIANTLAMPCGPCAVRYSENGKAIIKICHLVGTKAMALTMQVEGTAGCTKMMYRITA
ncbi:MAG: hypothetical protein DCC43_08175 [Candidatus Brocadia sp.]|jgi:hypothetical protein|uniref:Uncharacterized protein n=1 Tax=Candidatus Brocadia fulgida TaxID=380242 RepID=A0A0M2USZ0_9BACT|nr:MAG: hypothetical protein BROFUL_02151 [Candidatus Brocadia fulgida]MBV6517852.1 hypothetical protein [Candidatus Brocadia fulgida]MCE7911346.1 hypothetical protein [Candidatus Brocadia sp. AMX3]OQZ02642.1 MAG: hypothetical protein B6D35_00975 [Candidatus Brocadia sp. UTAMX2]RIJ99553.1 MAG: hypothetical protein DCC43_08175 [Candidatus Brocadia sp.]